ncbi:type II secretion system F family protein [Vibrio sp. JC009]|uniref:type II secretion system F family protein n=1 Tax=Vibrio sp. JC009 TaxID=2912314 RepID=UPI0023AE7275|nr:type II secretion system F family protein [Vibrio sp. JC009]WED21271.1 type II secretion system F family protein [Vibrio sp. JC009]
MDTITSLLSDLGLQYVDRQTLFLIVILVASILFFIAVGLLIIGNRSQVSKRLEDISSGNELGEKRSSRFGNTLDSLSPVLAPKSKKEQESIRHQLMHAGYHENRAVSTFYAVKTLTSIIGVIIAGAIWFYVPRSNWTDLAIVTALGVGIFSPNMMLSKMVSTRRIKLKAAVPDALDLLVVCTESGLGFNASLQRVANELAISHPDFSDELDTVCAKIKAGITVTDALGELVVRTGLEELSGLVSMLGHAAKIGGSLANTLRTYTDDYRDKRQQEAEEVAAKIPTKMLFPMILFIWPCFFIVAIGPGLVLVMDALK